MTPLTFPTFEAARDWAGSAPQLRGWPAWRVIRMRRTVKRDDDPWVIEYRPGGPLVSIVNPNQQE